MKILTVPFHSLAAARQESIDSFQALDTPHLDKSPLQPIGFEPWADGTGTTCQAGFAISHFGNGLCIHYSVVEPTLRTQKRKMNEAVHKDNCVEFFMAFGEERGYYNFEFNCLGSIKAAFGESRQHRSFLSPHLLRQIQESMEISLDNQGEGSQIRWTLTAILPLGAFMYHQHSSFSGLTGLANFTKCGDDLPNPHYLSWVNLVSEKPDFHQPSFFGKLIFDAHELK